MANGVLLMLSSLLQAPLCEQRPSSVAPLPQLLAIINRPMRPSLDPFNLTHDEHTCDVKPRSFVVNNKKLSRRSRIWIRITHPPHPPSLDDTPFNGSLLDHNVADMSGTMHAWT